MMNRHNNVYEDSRDINEILEEEERMDHYYHDNNRSNNDATLVFDQFSRQNNRQLARSNHEEFVVGPNFNNKYNRGQMEIVKEANKNSSIDFQSESEMQSTGRNNDSFDLSLSKKKSKHVGFSPDEDQIDDIDAIRRLSKSMPENVVNEQPIFPRTSKNMDQLFQKSRTVNLSARKSSFSEKNRRPTLASRRLKEYKDDKSEDSNQDDYYFTTQGNAYQYMNTLGEEVVNQPNPRFKNYSNVFKNLVKSSNIPTLYPIISVMITYDSQRAITVTKKNDEEYWIKQYSLESNELTFQEQIGAEKSFPQKYIKMKEVEQSPSGKKYAIAYNDNGWFWVRWFDQFPDGKEQERKQQTIKKSELSVNQVCDIKKNSTMCHHHFSDPFITVTFIDEDVICINLYENFYLLHYHFFYSTIQNKVIGTVAKHDFRDISNKSNFPYKCFFNDDLQEVYIFYRQGQAFIINISKEIDAQNYTFQRMTDADLGQMVLVYNRALIARSSSDILFFKLEIEEDVDKVIRVWKQYNKISSRGSIYYIKGNIRIQVTEDQKIFFYLIDKDTLEPIMENVMFNYMSCNQMMFGSKVRYCVTYKTNQKSFEVYRRKYEHDFKVPISFENFEGSRGLEIPSINAFVATQVDKINIYDQDTFEKKGQLPITLLKNEEREPNQVIAIQMSQNEELFAVISGKMLIMEQQKTNQLFIFRKIIDEMDGSFRFEQIFRVKLKDMPFFTQVCTQFYFTKQDGGDYFHQTIIFAKKDCVFELDYASEATTILFNFEEPFRDQPILFVSNTTQTMFFIATSHEGRIIDSLNDEVYDLHIDLQVSGFKGAIFEQDEGNFFIICNKLEEKLGFYMIQINQKSVDQFRFKFKWKHKLDIGDIDMSVLKQPEKGYKELIVSYKTIYLNTYNVIQIDLTVTDGNMIVCRHESFQLWESESKGIYLSNNKDYITVNKQGMQVLALGFAEKRAFIDHTGIDRMVHSVESCDYLKLESQNHLLFECSKPNARMLSVEQENRFGGKVEEVVTFQNLYKIKLHQVSLRELLLFSSLYVCKSLSEIVDIVNDQPKPEVFYKSCLELDGSNMVSILSFDSRSMTFLLQDDFKQYFTEDYPLFYRNKIQKSNSKELKHFYRSALESALRSNQVGAVSIIIEYICRFQNSFISSFLFKKIMPDLIEKGVSIASLMNSKIFNYEFDFDEWPATHSNSDEDLRPYNDSIFVLRKHYRTVFPEDEFMSLEEQKYNHGDEPNNMKVYKIKYSLNILTYIGAHVEFKFDQYSNEKSFECVNTNINFLELCVHSKELEIFKSISIQDLITFKWKEFAWFLHFFGCCIHVSYICILFIYNHLVYISGNQDEKKFDKSIEHQKLDTPYNWVLLAGILYPALYEFAQMYMNGLRDYFSDTGNYIDLIYIWGSVAMSIIHGQISPYHHISISLMCVITCLAIRRTFNFLKIFEALSPIVTMLSIVIFDLQSFMIFYFIQCMLFSLMIGVLGISNPQLPGKFQDEYVNQDGEMINNDGEYPPGAEYAKVGLMFGNFFSVMRISMGDFELISAVEYLSPIEQIMFWLVLTACIFVNCIIFLNFIIAQAGSTYNGVSQQIESFIHLQRASMVAEAEALLPQYMMNQDNFPKYIVVRKVDQ